MAGNVNPVVVRDAKVPGQLNDKCKCDGDDSLNPSDADSLTDTVADMNDTTSEPSAADRQAAAIERTSGMFAHLAPGVSLADELVADRRAEVRAEDQVNEAERSTRR